MNASLLVASLNQAFGNRQPQGTTDLYVAKVSEKCRNPDVLAKTYELLIENEERFPPLSRILSVYQSALPNRSSDDSLPAWYGLEEIPDDCIKCQTKIPLGELMKTNGFCPECEGPLLTYEESMVKINTILAKMPEVPEEEKEMLLVQAIRKESAMLDDDEEIPF